MFIDTAKILIIAGDGGSGCASFLRTRSNPRGGPDGGNGGRGGHVILKADSNMATLCDFFYQPRNKAACGKHGGSNKKNGAAGEDMILKIPSGTLIRNAETDELLADMTEPGQELLVAKGGKGGFGNVHFKSSTNRAPRIAQKGLEGEEIRLRLELKLMADVALVGYPNAGKSTCITAITHAHSKIASYPFTTRQPILGLLELSDFRTAVLADIPGLIDGAHRNIGLGHAFLRHVERCRMLMFVIDMGGVDQRDPRSDYEVLLHELENFNEDLLQRPRIVIANKMDLENADENLDAFKKRNPELDITPISALEGIGLEEMVKKLDAFLTASKLASETE